ncbi:cytochrome c oxidase subunit II [Reinekea marinisedimentorum]|uniref:cytochrome c oxidase subunit II n=1 Tax=Reinekea marinisedimentorum TaxID=230495 RepID=UPI00311EF84D
MLATYLCAPNLFAEFRVNMPEGVTRISEEVYSLHMLVFWVCVVIAIIVFGLMFYAIIKHRKSKGAVAKNFHESLKVEILWTAIPALIVFALGYRAFFTLEKMYDYDDSALTVEIVGYQWKWRYSYLMDDAAKEDSAQGTQFPVSFFSNLITPESQINNTEAKGEHYLLEVDEPLVLPVGSKVRFILTSADVIHSWWVPQLSVKKDAIPGIVNEAWTLIEKPGTYRGQCTELCGKGHGFMPVVVQAVSQTEFDQWMLGKQDEARQKASLNVKTWTMGELMETGERAYNTYCAACHQANGEGLPPAFPALKNSAIALGPVEAHLDIVINGSRVNPAMAAFGAQLSAAEIAAIITYERNAWGNNTGDMVTPQDVSNFGSSQ